MNHDNENMTNEDVEEKYDEELAWELYEMRISAPPVTGPVSAETVERIKNGPMGFLFED